MDRLLDVGILVSEFSDSLVIERTKAENLIKQENLLTLFIV